MEAVAVAGGSRHLLPLFAQANTAQTPATVAWQINKPTFVGGNKTGQSSQCPGLLALSAISVLSQLLEREQFLTEHFFVLFGAFETFHLLLDPLAVDRLVVQS